MGTKVFNLLFLHFLNDGIRSTFLVILPFIAKDLSLSLSFSGILGSLLALGTAVFALPAGFIGNRIGGLKLLITLLAIYSIGSLTIGFSPNYLILTAAFLLGALGFGMFHAIAFSIVGRNSEKTNVGKNMANFTSMGEIGRVAIPPAIVFLVSLTGWRISMIMIGVLGIVIYFILSFSISKDTSISDIKQENHSDFLKNAFSLLKQKRFFLTSLIAIIDTSASSPLYIFLPFLLVYKGFSASQLGIAMGIFFIGSLFGKSILGRSVDKIGNRKVFIFSELFMAFSLILVSISSGFIVLLIFTLFLGVFTKGTSPVVQTMFSELSDKKHYNKVYGISELLIGFSAVISQIGMGILADKFGITTIFYFCAILAATAIFPVVLMKTKKEANLQTLRLNIENVT